MDDPMNRHRKYIPPPTRDSSSFKIGLVANQFQSSYVMRIPNNIRVMKFQVLSETIKFYRNNNRSLALKSPCRVQLTSEGTILRVSEFGCEAVSMFEIKDPQVHFDV